MYSAFSIRIGRSAPCLAPFDIEDKEGNGGGLKKEMERLKKKKRYDYFGRKKNCIYGDKQHVKKINFMYCCSIVCGFTLKRVTSLSFDASKHIRAAKQHIVMTIRPFDV